MKVINGREWVTRAELVGPELRRASTSTLKRLWRHRATNGHPPAVRIDGVMHWDLAEWDTWHAEEIRQRNTDPTRGRRTAAATVDRSGDPDELLAPRQQAAVLGIDESAISRYREHPPAGWPPPDATETKPSGGVREYRTRRTLWAYADRAAEASTIGVAGRKPGPQPDRRREPYEGDPRVEIAAAALATAHPDQSRESIAADLAGRHGSSPRTWKRILAAAAERTR